MVPLRFIIHTNARINDTFGYVDHLGVPFSVDPELDYRCDIKRDRDDAEPLLSFGPTGDNTVTVVQVEDADPTYYVFWLQAPIDAVASLVPGIAVGDVVSTTGDFQMEFPVSIIRGITEL